MFLALCTNWSTQLSAAPTPGNTMLEMVGTCTLPFECAASGFAHHVKRCCCWSCTKRNQYSDAGVPFVSPIVNQPAWISPGNVGDAGVVVVVVVVGVWVGCGGGGAAAFVAWGGDGTEGGRATLCWPTTGTGSVGAVASGAVGGEAFFCSFFSSEVNRAMTAVVLLSPSGSKTTALISGGISKLESLPHICCTVRPSLLGVFTLWVPCDLNRLVMSCVASCKSRKRDARRMVCNSVSP